MLQKLVHKLILNKACRHDVIQIDSKKSGESQSHSPKLLLNGFPAKIKKENTINNGISKNCNEKNANPISYNSILIRSTIHHRSSNDYNNKKRYFLCYHAEGIEIR